MRRQSSCRTRLRGDRRAAQLRAARWLFAPALLFAGGAASGQALIVVSDAGASSSTTCTLAQAIGLANSAYAFAPAAVGSATTDLGVCQFIPPPQPPAFLPPAPPYTLLVVPGQITLASIDNYWYGPNALPPIGTAISIAPASGVLRLRASHAGDPAPATADAFRFFYVSGGLELPAGSLTLTRMVIEGGYAKGGNSGNSGGAGAGMGGAVFNQGTLVLSSVSLLGNVAQGGLIVPVPATTNGGGGMGQDAQPNSIGGGMGGFIGSGFGGSGSESSFNGGGGGGGGFIAGSSAGFATSNTGAAGGGLGGLGGHGAHGFDQFGGIAGDGGGGGCFAVLDSGGAFGSGGGYASGGGVGGGGGAANTNCGGGGGFGGGGAGMLYADGGFGGAGAGAGSGGFGGGSNGGGGSGMGGAIFNHAGTVSLVNVTASGNSARGGDGSLTNGTSGSGLGAVLFNLNGSATIDFSTLAGNTTSGNNGRGADAEDAAVYSLAYGNRIQDGGASAATLILSNSIIHGTHGDGGAGDDVLVNVVDGAQVNSSSVTYKGKNFVQFSANLGNVTQTGSSPTQADPHLGALSVYAAAPNLLPVLPLGADTPAQYAGGTCVQADGSTGLATDERGIARPSLGACTIGAYQFDGDYIFAANNDALL